MIPAPLHFLLRLRRDGPIVPAKLWWCDADPADPENRRDRGRLSIWPRAAAAGEEIGPELIFERLGINPFSGDQVALGHELLARLDRAEPPLPTHWKYAEPISAEAYAYHFARLRWAERNAPGDPTLAPRRRVQPAQMSLPNFDRENAL